MSECNLCQEIEEAVPANYDTSIMFLNTADHLYFQFRFQEIWRPVEALLTDNPFLVRDAVKMLKEDTDAAGAADEGDE